MGVTYTSARDRASRTSPIATLATRDLAIVCTAVIAMLTLSLAYVGRMRTFSAADVPGATRVNLAEAPTADQLLPIVGLALAAEADRRFAARELAKVVATTDFTEGLANVGALTRVTVATSDIERTRGLRTYADRLREARGRASTGGLTAPTTLPLFTANEVGLMKPALVVRTTSAHRWTTLMCILGLALSLPLVALVWRLRGIPGDPLLLAAAHLLLTLGGLVMLSRPDPLRDTLLLVRYTQSVVLAAVCCGLLSLIRMRTATFLRFSYLALVGAIGLALTLMVFGSGPGTSSAKVNLGPFQPVELIRLLLAVFLAGYLGHRWELLRQVRETTFRSRQLPAWLDLPRFEQLFPVLGGVFVALLLFFALRDLGPALLLSLVFVVMLTIARAGAGAMLIGLGVLVGGFVAGYWLSISNTLTARVAMWRSPWENTIRGGDQVAQGVWALATGGVSGTGAGLGDTRYLPAGHTDLVLAAVGEELGLVGLLVVALSGTVVAWRGLRIARRAPTDTTFFLAVALTLSLVVPMLVMAAGILGLIPLTGVVTPFLSYGGSAMLANFAALGLLAAIASDPGQLSHTEPFAPSLRWVSRGLAAAALVIVIALARVQAVSADGFLVRPQLSLQGDGGLRYQYNPRVLDAARSLPRGVIRDRRDLPIAGTPEDIATSKAEFDRLHITLRDTCPASLTRCYPLGGQAFHLLGDAERRDNWAASNTSYVERDAEDALRGFDDRATTVRTAGTDATGPAALKRDYSDLIPLVRHRWEPEHDAVKAIRARSRDVSVTIDARLQLQVASILAEATRAAGVTKAAAVVLDASTGEVLASVSYPWPSRDPLHAMDPDAVLDRARYGLYPPGSTFKLVTAAAALRLDPDLQRLAFTCSRLPDGRIGAKLPGWGRPVRDDVKDTHEHGTLAMHDAMVRSCNAYFAQLAVRLGTEPLAQTSDLAGVIFPTTGTPARVRENLPPSGYGQGDVLATPLRLARLSAAIATDGTIREPSIVRDDAVAPSRTFLPGRSAEVLARYMRDAVTDGTGRLLASHPSRIAGKTGTAEVDDARSHAWFVGFAPFGPAERRVAFAVILENAGYGGSSAASVAGRIVTAASALGLVQ